MVVSRWCSAGVSSCPGCVSVVTRGVLGVSWWYLSCVLVVSRLCLGGILVQSSRCLGCVLVVFWWYLGGVLVMSRWCLGLVLVVSWWLLGGFCRVSVVSWWTCGAAAAETRAKIGSNKKRETVLLGLYARLIIEFIFKFRIVFV